MLWWFMISFLLNLSLLQGFISAVFGLLCLSLQISFNVFVTQCSKSGYVKEPDTKPAR